MMVKSRRDKDGAGPNFGRKQLEIKLTVFFFFSLGQVLEIQI